MARTESAWQEINGSYLTTQWAAGRDILINGTNKYLNFGSISGSSGYGFRDNSGVMQVKNSGGAWANFGSGSGTGTVDSVVAGTGITVDATDPANPEVALDAATQASLALADTALQPGDISVATPTFIFSSTNSDISGYESAPSINLYTAAALANNGGTAASTTPAIMEEFATNVGFPNLTLIPTGTILVHFETQKSAGSNNYYCYAEIYKRTSGGAETLIATTDNSSQSALNTLVQQTVTAELASNVTLNATDRIVVKIYVVMVSSTATVTLYYDDTTSARVELPAVSVDASTFVTLATDQTITGVKTFNANIYTAGQVGINTSDPDAAGSSAASAIPNNKLAVVGAITFGEVVAASEANLPAIVQSSSNGAAQDLSIGARSTTGKLRFFTGNAGAVGDFGASSNAERMSISATGVVTIANLTTAGIVTNTAAGVISTTTAVGVTLGGTGTSTQFTQGSIVFAGASGVYTQDNTNLFWDDSTNLLKVSQVIVNGGTQQSVNLTGTTAGVPVHQVVGTSQPTSSSLVMRFIANTTGSAYVLGKSRGTTVGTNTVLLDSDIVGHISFVGADGTIYPEGARMSAWVDGTPASGTVPMRFNFYTADAGDTSAANLRMTIRATGFVGIGVNSPQSILALGTSRSLDSWTITGSSFASQAATFTDLTGTGTVGKRVGSSIASPTFASTSAVTVTDAASFYIAAAAVAGTNTTLTNTWSLWVDAGNTRLDGTLNMGGAILPQSNDLAAIGSATLSFSDLFLASGGVINFNNGNATLTHSTGLITSNVPFSVGTSNAITAGSYEVGAASDTTITRTAAGIIAVEGEVINGYATTATAAGTTALTIASATTQFFTGTTTQTVTLPTTSVVVGQTYRIVNTSTGSVTVQSSGANTIQILGAGMSAHFTAIVATPTTAADWVCSLTSATGQNIAQTASANAATVNLAYVTNTITNNSAATLTITLPTAGAIDGEMRIVRVLDFSAVAQTITWTNTENSTATAPTTSNGSTTLPITAGFQYNSATSKWRCTAAA